MANLQELKTVVKETLEKRGVLGQIKARVRAEVFNALDDQADPRPPLSNENMIINELIREYLEYNKYKYTASVMLAETGQPKTPLNREFLAEQLNVVEDKTASSLKLPLLYSIIAQFTPGSRHQVDKPAHQEQHGRGRMGLLEQLDRDRIGHSHDGLAQDPLIMRGGYR
ncbi:lisH domain-containing protein FOPNL [Lingula anatina]|uniref:Centrosomal protein 20 n=1 Tax=Lingula anatina TaxID=7574 RepID=A0A1S3I2D6_LINAN|nr:lisH domain-containing protein FOPNL [Lingula anatina]XP_013421300.1 lisH domain-containing protein FOPNL [Lingula anatina]|eukprot:XP_013392432.1 lisH domain-containing protein FOPNL [Lingula anatina]